MFQVPVPSLQLSHSRYCGLSAYLDIQRQFGGQFDHQACCDGVQDGELSRDTEKTVLMFLLLVYSPLS